MITQTPTFPSGERTLNAYFARPDGEGPFPGVLLIHEAFGLNDNMRDITRRFAGQGYAALGVDLFTGRSRVACMFRLFWGAMTDSLNHPGIADLKAALDFLSVQPEVDAARLGAAGYCLGGGLVIALACADQRLKAIAPYYGMNPRPQAAMARLCPVVGSYPAEDFTAQGARQLDLALDEYAIPHDIKIYPGARHSFFNERNPRSYNPEAAQDSWERVLGFFKEYV